MIFFSVLIYFFLIFFCYLDYKFRKIYFVMIFFCRLDILSLIFFFDKVYLPKFCSPNSMIFFFAVCILSSVTSRQVSQILKITQTLSISHAIRKFVTSEEISQEVCVPISRDGSLMLSPDFFFFSYLDCKI